MIVDEVRRMPLPAHKPDCPENLSEAQIESLRVLVCFVIGFAKNNKYFSSGKKPLVTASELYDFKTGRSSLSRANRREQLEYIYTRTFDFFSNADQEQADKEYLFFPKQALGHHLDIVYSANPPSMSRLALEQMYYNLQLVFGAEAGMNAGVNNVPANLCGIYYTYRYGATENKGSNPDIIKCALRIFHHQGVYNEQTRFNLVYQPRFSALPPVAISGLVLSSVNHLFFTGVDAGANRGAFLMAVDIPPTQDVLMLNGIVLRRNSSKDIVSSNMIALPFDETLGKSRNEMKCAWSAARKGIGIFPRSEIKSCLSKKHFDWVTKAINNQVDNDRLWILKMNSPLS